jgi:S1-C subfamily serine protease
MRQSIAVTWLLWVVMGLPTATFADIKPLGCPEAKLPLPTARNLLTKNELYQLAQQVTVKVQAANISGSGVIFDSSARAKGGRTESQNGTRYRILTNAHNLLQAETAQIQTSDNQLHTALRTHTQVLLGTDLAVLEFNSRNVYRSAPWLQQPIAKETVVAAGFEFDRPEVTISAGEVTLVLPQPLRRGYQLGYSGRVRQGMSGGPILDQTGLLLGVNAIAAYPIVNRGYIFMDGTRPSPMTIKQLRRSNWGIPVAPYLACIK